MNDTPEPLLFELIRPVRLGAELPDCDVPIQALDALLPGIARREALPLPELS